MEMKNELRMVMVDENQNLTRRMMIQKNAWKVIGKKVQAMAPITSVKQEFPK